MAALREQTVQGFETVVVVDGSDQAPPPLRVDKVIIQSHGGPGSARNRGVSATTRALVLFLGDDMLPDRQLVERHLDAHRRHPEPTSAVLGRVEWHPEVGRDRLTSWMDWSGAQFDYHNIRGDDAGWGRFYSCNVSMKRSLFVEAGGFDENFTFDYEDLDLAWRLHVRGLELWYEPDALALHLHSYDWERVLARYESRARAERRMEAKHDWFKPYFAEAVRHAASQRRASPLWSRVVERVPAMLPGARTFARERANRWYHQRAAPRFLAVWDGVPAQAELEEYLGDAFDLDLLQGHAAAVELESAECPDEATFYRTSAMYLYDLTAFAMTGTKRPYLNDLGRFVAPGAAVLDYGCGIGSDGLQLLAEGYRVAFADFTNPSTAYLRWRLARRDIDAAVYDLDADEIPEGFDAAYSLDVIEHVDDPFEFLRELERRAAIVMVNLLEPELDDSALHRSLPIPSLLDHAHRQGILRYRRYHGRSHLVVYRTTRPAMRGRVRSLLQRRLGAHLRGSL